MQVPAHRLGVVEPGLADDVLAVVGLELLDGGLRRGRRAKRLPLLVDPSRLLDQLRGVVLVLRVDAPNLPVGLEVDPGVELGRRAVARPLPMRVREQARKGFPIAARVVAARSLVIRGRVEVRLLFPRRETAQPLGKQIHGNRLRRDYVSRRSPISAAIRAPSRAGRRAPPVVRVLNRAGWGAHANRAAQPPALRRAPPRESSLMRWSEASGLSDTSRPSRHLRTGLATTVDRPLRGTVMRTLWLSAPEIRGWRTRHSSLRTAPSSSSSQARTRRA